jgi:hypothetical protein
MQNLQIDFEHAILAVLDACEHSDNVTPDEFELVLSLLKKAKAQSEPILCPHCGSIHVGMVDYEPLATHASFLGEDELKGWGPYDTELYSTFKCFFCKETFRKVLEVSHQ